MAGLDKRNTLRTFTVASARYCMPHELHKVFSLSATPVKWRVAEDYGVTVAPPGMGAFVGYSVNVFHSTDFCTGSIDNNG